MANNILLCPHCQGQIKAIPLKSAVPSPPAAASTFETVSQSLFETESPTHTIEKSSFWQSDGIRYAIAGLFAGVVLLTFSWWYELNLGWLVALIVLLIGVTPHFLKIMLHKPPSAAEPGASGTTTIKVEHWGDDNKRVLLHEIQDERIELSELRRVARAVISDGHNFSRPALTKHAKISQSKFQAIKSEFERLNYAHTTKGNMTVLTPRCKAFLKKLAALP